MWEYLSCNGVHQTVRLSNGSRLAAFFSLVALFIVAAVPFSSCACDAPNAPQLATFHGALCRHGGQSTAHANPSSRSCCARHHARWMSCRCGFVARNAIVAATFVHCDVVALLPAPMTLPQTPHVVLRAFAPTSPDPPRRMIARLFPARAPPALAFSIQNFSPTFGRTAPAHFAGGARAIHSIHQEYQCTPFIASL